MSPEEQRVIMHSFIERATITKMTAPAAQLETAFRVMQMEAAFIDWLAGKKPVQHNNYRSRNTLNLTNLTDALSVCLKDEMLGHRTMGRYW
jgi:hypothetical protein